MFRVNLFSLTSHIKQQEASGFSRTRCSPCQSPGLKSKSELCVIDIFDAVVGREGAHSSVCSSVHIRNSPSSLKDSHFFAFSLDLGLHHSPRQGHLRRGIKKSLVKPEGKTLTEDHFTQTGIWAFVFFIEGKEPEIKDYLQETSTHPKRHTPTCWS